MLFFFSGGSVSPKPMHYLRDFNAQQGPCVMMTADEIRRNCKAVINRFEDHCHRRGEPIWKFFLDSGAFSIYNREVFKKKLESKHRFAYYESDEFWSIVDNYGAYIKKHKKHIDFYANLDVLRNPELSWRVQRHLEDKYGISPVPVLHWGCGKEWIRHYLREGYEMCGIGSALEVSRQSQRAWMDWVFDELPKGFKVHGFAQTGFEVMRRYPWFSVDSAAWVKRAGYGIINVPRKRRGVFVFNEVPYMVFVDVCSPYAKERHRHVRSMVQFEKNLIYEWLEEIQIPMGQTKRDKSGAVVFGEDKKPVRIIAGVENNSEYRGLANMIYYQRMADSLSTSHTPFRHSRVGFAINHIS